MGFDQSQAVQAPTCFYDQPPCDGADVKTALSAISPLSASESRPRSRSCSAVAIPVKAKRKSCRGFRHCLTGLLGKGPDADEVSTLGTELGSAVCAVAVTRASNCVGFRTASGRTRSSPKPIIATPGAQRGGRGVKGSDRAGSPPAKKNLYRSWSSVSEPSTLHEDHCLLPSNGSLAAIGQEQVTLSSFRIRKEIGRGAFGKVYAVTHLESEKVYAAKVIDKKVAKTEKLLGYMETEQSLLSRLKHPYMVSMAYAFQTSDHLILVMQHCPGGSFQGLLKRNKCLKEPLARLYTAELLLAFIHLHNMKVVYRDLKPENVMLDELGHAMLIDFGLSKEGVTSLSGAKSQVGTPAFLAPEIVQKRPYGHTVDIYGLGVFLFNLLVGTPPFFHKSRAQMLKNIRESQLDLPAHVSAPAGAFIQETMRRNPSERPGAASTDGLCEHDFFAGLDWDAVLAREVTAPLPDTERAALEEAIANT